MAFVGSDIIKTSTEIVGKFEDWQTEQHAKVRKAAGNAIEAQALKVLETARSLCPVGNDAEHDKHPGNLRDSLYVKLSAEKLFATVRADHTKAGYAHLVHFGSKHNRANPFLYQASDIHRAELEPSIKSEIDNA